MSNYFFPFRRNVKGQHMSDKIYFFIWLNIPLFIALTPNKNLKILFIKLTLELFNLVSLFRVCDCYTFESRTSSYFFLPISYPQKFI